MIFPSHTQVYALEAGRSVLSKVLISGGGRCNVMHNPSKGPNEISKVGNIILSFYIKHHSC